jgi:hypothetical protein
MPPKERYPSTTLQKCQYLWDEYKYRHDLIWQRIFRFTTAVVLISIIPYVQQQIASLLDIGILIAPVLATLLAVFVRIVIRNELEVFRRIKTAYRRQQNKLLDDDLKHDRDENGRFEWLVLLYLAILGVLSVVNVGIAALVWLPKLRVLTVCLSPGS